jgi:hypothetical protein
VSNCHKWQWLTRDFSASEGTKEGDTHELEANGYNLAVCLVTGCTVVLATGDSLGYVSSGWQESETNPPASNETAFGRGENSRVEAKNLGQQGLLVGPETEHTLPTVGERNFQALNSVLEQRVGHKAHGPANRLFDVYSYERTDLVLRRTGRLRAGSFHSGVVSHLGRLSRVVVLGVVV